MDMLIFLVILFGTILNINGEHCNEQECHNGLNSWCCPSSKTCGNIGICNDTILKNKDAYCPGQQTCSSSSSLNDWCCSLTETCGDYYQSCRDIVVYNPLSIYKYVGISFGVLIVLATILGCLCRYRRVHAIQMQSQQQSQNQGVIIQPNYPNMSNPVQQPYQSPRNNYGYA